MSGRHPWALGRLGVLFASTGDTAGAAAVLDELTARSRVDEHVSTGIQALLRGSLGHLDDAFDVLERTFDQPDPWLFYIRGPIFESLRGDPRLDAMIERLYPRD